MSKFIAIEGIEGAGKSTLRAHIANASKEFGVEVIFTREPGATLLGKSIRSILLDPENTSLADMAELMLFAADRAQHVFEVIRPALKRGALVICDRYTYSTLAYQGAGRGIELNRLNILNEMVTDGLAPDLVLLLDISPEDGLKRVQERTLRASGSFNAEKLKDGSDPALTTDRFEQQSIEFHNRVRNGFLELSKDPKNKFLVLDATQSPDDVARRAIEAIKKTISR